MKVYSTLKEAGLTSEKEITERSLRNTNKNAIDRSNLGQFGPLMKLFQFQPNKYYPMDSSNDRHPGWDQYNKRHKLGKYNR